MTNYIWGHERRFNAYSNYFKQTFGERIQKVTIDAGFTCPNRDGLLGFGGCTYCNNNAFNPSYCVPSKSIKQQIKEGIEFHKNRYRRANKFLAYFQAYSNTYASLDKLKQIYNQALEIPEIAGIVIGTRPDCIDNEKLKYFKEVSESHYVIIEYGIESIYNKTLKRINRGHTFEKSCEAIEKTADMGINTGAHMIFGLPDESEDDIMKEAEVLSKLPLKTIKFHQLQIIKDTAMETEYKKFPENFNFFTLDEYIDFFIRFIERFDPNIVVERFAGEVPPCFLAGPGWGKIRNDQILNKFEKRLEELDTWQGKYFNV